MAVKPGKRSWIRGKGKNIGVVDWSWIPPIPISSYAATYDKVRKPYTYNLAAGKPDLQNHGWRENWNKLAGGLPEGMLGRIGIDIYLRNPNIVYPASKTPTNRRCPTRTVKRNSWPTNPAAA